MWNPVSNNVLAVVTENAGLIIYTLKSPGVELCSLDGQQTVQSASWSPKGKQIVAGFPNGNLIQFKPDLKAARSIPCPGNLLGSTFDTIAIQWLATYQFAAVFQSKVEDTTPGKIRGSYLEKNFKAIFTSFFVCLNSSAFHCQRTQDGNSQIHKLR